jgi:hypothetical protein
VVLTIVLVGSFAAVAIVAATFLRTDSAGTQLRNSWSADVQYADESRTEAVALSATYSLSDDKVIDFVLHPQPSGRVPMAWRVSGATGEITARVLRGTEVMSSFVLSGDGCQFVSLPSGTTYSLEIRVAAPADGRLELAWRDVQDCG